MFTRRSFPSTAAIHMFLAGCLFLQGSPSFAAGQGGSDRGGEVKTPPGRQCIPNPRKLKLPSPPFCPAAPVGAVTGPFCPLGSCPPPPPPLNATVDTNSAQTIYGQKSFMQPLQGTLDGVAMYADQFLGSLTGDVAGPQWATQVVNVSAGALPSIGFGPGAGPRVKHVFADADPADPRADGSIAHPFASLAQAAPGAIDGDRFILSGILSGTIVFPAAVSIEGAGPSETYIYGTLEFAGSGESRISGVSVNCATAAPCVMNRASPPSALTLENVIVSQSLDGGAVATGGGNIVARRSRFISFGIGAALKLNLLGAGGTRITDTDVVNSLTGIALDVTGGTVRVDGGTVYTAGKAPAVALAGASSFVARGADFASAGVVIDLRNSRSAQIDSSVLSAGAGAVSVTINNDPIRTFIADRGPGLVFANNVFKSDIPDVFTCAQVSTVSTRGNLVPLYPGLLPLSGLVSGCQRASFAGF